MLVHVQKDTEEPSVKFHAVKHALVFLKMMQVFALAMVCAVVVIIVNVLKVTLAQNVILFHVMELLQLIQACAVEMVNAIQ